MIILGVILLWTGVAFMAVTAIGLLRLPDFYSRLHAVSKTETLGLTLVMLGLALNTGAGFVLVKLLMAAVFIQFSGPASAHLLARAAARLGEQPWTRAPGRESHGAGMNRTG